MVIPKCVLWQAVMTQIKCLILRHFIRIYTVCQDKNNFQNLKIITCDTLNYIMDKSIIMESTCFVPDIKYKRHILTKSSYIISVDLVIILYFFDLSFQWKPQFQWKPHLRPWRTSLLLPMSTTVVRMVDYAS